MLTALAELTLRGTMVFLLVWLVERAVSHRMHPQLRRSWWWLAALAFLLPLDLSHAPRLPEPLRALRHTVALFTENPTPEIFLDEPASTPSPSARQKHPFTAVWALGFTASLAVVLFRTRRTQRQWSRERLCTDASLLSLLEDAKASAHVTAPIGLVVSDSIAAPALLGWLRPRPNVPTTARRFFPCSATPSLFLLRPAPSPSESRSPTSNTASS